MAWRPYENLIDGEVDNRTPGKVNGWLRFYRRGMQPLRMILDLAGDFHEDIRGKVIRLSNPNPCERNGYLEREGTYMDGFDPLQHGEAGDITAGLPVGRGAKGKPSYAYVPYPYIEWYGPNGRVVLELDASEIEIVDGATVRKVRRSDAYLTEMDAVRHLRSLVDRTIQQSVDRPEDSPSFG